MAGIRTRPDGRKAIRFVVEDGSRKEIQLGKISDRLAERYRARIETLLSHKTANSQIDPGTVAWLQGLDNKLHAKLAAAGLVTARTEQSTSSSLKAFIDGYIAMKGSMKPNTHRNYLQTRRWLVEYFGEDKPLTKVTPGDAEELRLFMKRKGLAENTLRRHLKRARQFFRHAERKHLIPNNPFGELKGLALRGNREKFHFVSVENARRVLEACPDQEWRTIFALSRWGGLRCPSEHLALTWVDVDWENKRLRVRSPKTEHHENGAYRVIPLFPELKCELKALRDEAGLGDIHVICHHRGLNKNLRTYFKRIVEKAGIVPWPDIFHNLRRTRQTELAAKHPNHVVCEWLGNSEAIATEHYLRTTEDDFRRALEPSENVPHFHPHHCTEMSGTGLKEVIPVDGNRKGFKSIREDSTSEQMNKYTRQESNL